MVGKFANIPVVVKAVAACCAGGNGTVGKTYGLGKAGKSSGFGPVDTVGDELPELDLAAQAQDGLGSVSAQVNLGRLGSLGQSSQTCQRTVVGGRQLLGEPSRATCPTSHTRSGLGSSIPDVCWTPVLVCRHAIAEHAVIIAPLIFVMPGCAGHFNVADGDVGRVADSRQRGDRLR